LKISHKELNLGENRKLDKITQMVKDMKLQVQNLRENKATMNKLLMIKAQIINLEKQDIENLENMMET